jgi:hypothetical protein
MTSEMSRLKAAAETIVFRARGARPLDGVNALPGSFFAAAEIDVDRGVTFRYEVAYRENGYRTNFRLRRRLLSSRFRSSRGTRRVHSREERRSSINGRTE